MRLDVATTADVDRLTDLWVALAADQRAHGSHLAAEGNRSAMHRAIASAVVEDRIVVVRPETDDGEPDGVRGFVMFTIEHGIYAQDVTRGRIQNLYVEPAVRNRNFGTALVERAEAALAERGADVITVDAMAGNDGARRLYERLHFEPHRVEFEKPVTTAESDRAEDGPGDGTGDGAEQD